jgi:hypothetical protein
MKLSAIGTVAVLHFITVFVREGHGDEVHSVTIPILKPGLKLLCRLILLSIDQGWMRSFTVDVPRLYGAWKILI